MKLFSSAILRLPSPEATRASGPADTSDGGQRWPDYERVLSEQAVYAQVLRSLGVDVRTLPALDAHPHAMFVQDMAVVLPEISVIARPRDQTRLDELASIEEVLAPYRPIGRIHSPGVLDGSDVLEVEKHVFIGLSARTDRDGARQLSTILEPLGYTTSLVPLSGDVRLRSLVGELGGRRLVIARELAQTGVFGDFELALLDHGETHACNAFHVNGAVLMSQGPSGGVSGLAGQGLSLIELDLRATAALSRGPSCLSLRL